MRVIVHVTPGARRELVCEVKQNEYGIAVKELAEGNAANNRVRELIALQYGVVMSAVRFITGNKGSRKTFEVLR